MNKPNGWETTEAKSFGVNQKPPAGAYVMKILAAKDASSSGGRPMLSLCLDIAEGPFKDNFKKLLDFFKKNNPESKYPLVHRRCQDGEQLPYFKGDLKAIEESNEGFKFNFDEKTLVGKLVGCMLGELAYAEDSDGNLKTKLEPRWLMSAKSAREFVGKPPEMKKDKNFGKQRERQAGDEPTTPDEDLPF
jgi:hypothetical protein